MYSWLSPVLLEFRGALFSFGRCRRILERLYILIVINGAGSGWLLFTWAFWKESFYSYMSFNFPFLQSWVAADSFPFHIHRQRIHITVLFKTKKNTVPYIFILQGFQFWENNTSWNSVFSFLGFIYIKSIIHIGNLRPRVCYKLASWIKDFVWHCWGYSWVRWFNFFILILEVYWLSECLISSLSIVQH
jgi:hypothetical protein